MSDFREQHLRDRDFLGAFGVLRRGDRVLLVENERKIDGALAKVWDLPGGQVEPGELLGEALSRELREELDIEVRGAPEFLFFQEGERVTAGHRKHAWRSFFFAVGEYAGEPTANAEILDVRWFAPAELTAVLTAPYHDSFAAWLERGGAAFDSRWVE